MHREVLPKVGAFFMSEVTKARSVLANAVKRERCTDDPGPAVVDARRALAAAKLEAYIRHVVATAPALSKEQRDRLALLLAAHGAGS